MKTLSIVATFVAKPECREAAIAELLKLVDPTRQEQGCIKYSLYSDNEDENTFLFEEEWQSDAHLKAHTQSAHFTAFTAATEGMFTSFTVKRVTQIA